MNSPNSNLTETKTFLASIAKEAAELKQAMRGSIIPTVADWLAPQYLLAARDKLTEANGDERLEVLRALVQDWALLRRCDLSAARLQLAREELDWLRANGRIEKEKEFWQWTEIPEIHAKLFPQGGAVTKETLDRAAQALNLM